MTNLERIQKNNADLDKCIETASGMSNSGGGGDGGNSQDIKLQSKTVTPTESTQNVTPDSGYDGLSKVTVNPIPSDYIIPSGTKSITTNGTHDVKDYASVSVNVASSGGDNGLIKNMVTATGTFSLTASDLQGITKITDYAFYGRTNLTSVDIPDGVKSIGSRAFYNCTNLSNITIPNSVTSIDSGAFYNCDGLTSFTFPNNVKTVSDTVFYHCSYLVSVTIPASVTLIEVQAFFYCIRLTTVKIERTTPPTLEGNAFGVCDNLSQIIVPTGASDAYKSATNWSQYADIIVEES